MLYLANIRFQAWRIGQVLHSIGTGKIHSFMQGDLRFLPESAKETISSLRRYKGVRFSTIKNTIRYNNRKLYLPLVSEAVQGDKDAQLLYQGIRFLQYANLPKWGQEMITAGLAKAYYEFNPKRHVPASQPKLLEKMKLFAEHKRKTKDLDSAYIHTIPDTLGLNAFTNYQRLSDFALLSAELPFRNHFIFRYSVASALQELKYFSVGNEGPLGKIAATTLQTIVPQMLTMAILQDHFGEYLERIPSKVLCEVVARTSSPWQVFDGRQGKNIQAIHLYLEGYGLYTSLSEDKIADTYIQLSEVKDITSALNSRFHKELGIPLKTSPKESERNPNIDGIDLMIRERHPELQEGRDLARRIYKMQKRAGLSYHSIIDRMMRGTEPYDLLENLHYEVSKKGQEGKAVSTTHEEVIEPQQQQYDETTSFRIKRVMIPSFLKSEIDSMSAEAQELLASRLYRISIGNYGDSKTISGGIVMSRIHRGPGYRLYLYHFQDQIVALGYGKKADQVGDIKRVKIKIAALKKQQKIKLSMDSIESV